MKCRLKQCKARCCYNIPFADGELEKYADKIVTPVIDTVPLGPAVVAFTVPVSDRLDLMANAMHHNRCPFLRHDYTCNIYEHRPDVCRKYGEIEQLPCNFRKP